ncbi:MAG: cation transporter [Rhizobiaceae bacterium]|nr:cation transporter [Rhizobiaceae bacterium]
MAHSHAGSGGSHAHGHGHRHDERGGHDHNHHGAGRDHSHGVTDKRRVLIAALLTGGFMVVEAAGGLLTGSLALLADAGHMLTDSISLALAWYAFHLSERPATSSLSYGFDRVKTLVAYTNGLAIFAIAAWIVYEAALRLYRPEPVIAGPMLIVALAGLAVNLLAFYVLHGGDREGLNMRGAILHVVGDMLGSVGAIVAALIIMATGWYPVDPILSVLVAVILFRSAWSLVRDSGHLLLEGTPKSLDRDGIARDLVAHVPLVREVHHMHVWSLDGSKNIATLHACLREGADAHMAVSAIKERLAANHSIAHATVETEIDCCADAADHRLLH